VRRTAAGRCESRRRRSPASAARRTGAWSLARRAAIKLIRPEALGGDARDRRIALARFEREAQSTASLRSPNTIELYDFGVSDTGSFFYVMELLVGQDAQSLVRSFGQQPPERVLYLLDQICDSLAEAHAAGLVHRDIKPSNVYVCREGLHYVVLLRARVG
jgi:serine/threonine-protein kinase